MAIPVEKTNINIGWPAAIAVLIFTISTTWAISTGLHNIGERIDGVRSEMHMAIDSVKSKQTQRAYQSDMKFQKIEDKLDQISEQKK